MTPNETVVFGRVLKWSIVALTVMLAVFLGLVVWSVWSGQTATHQTIADRIGNVERMTTETNCVAFIPVEERTPVRLAECRLPAPTVN